MSLDKLIAARIVAFFARNNAPDYILAIMQSSIRTPSVPYGGPVFITSDSAPQLQIVRADGRSRMSFSVGPDGAATIGATAPITIATPLQVANLQMSRAMMTIASINERAPVDGDLAIAPSEFGSTIRVGSAPGPPTARAVTAPFTITLPTGSAILDMVAARFSASARVDGASVALQIVNDSAYNATIALTLVSVQVRTGVRQLAALDSITPSNVVVLAHSSARIVAVLTASAPARAMFVIEGAGDAISATAPLAWDATARVMSATPASAEVAGIVTTGAQTIAGVKTFVGVPKTSRIPADNDDLATVAYVAEHTTSAVSWQRSVLSFYDMTTPPVGPADGARYIATVTGGAITVNRVYQWSAGGAVWQEQTPLNGWTLYVEGGAQFAMQVVTYNGAEWVFNGGTLLHQSLIGAGAYTHADIDARAGAIVTPEMFGAVGDGVTDDGAALAAACAAAGSLRKGKIVGRPGAKYWTAAAFANPLGASFDQSMSVYIGTSCITGRARDQLVTGQEYLFGFIGKIATRSAIRVLFSGDSTTSGQLSDAPSFSDRVPNIFLDMCIANGLTNIAVLNYGQSGKKCEQWATTYVGPEIAAAPDVWVWRWGLNDTNSSITPAQFSTNMRSGLEQIRATYPLSSGVSIVVMTPNARGSGLDSYFESYNDVIREAARDYQCCFIDTRTLWRDAVSGANMWMDAISLHPRANFNQQIASAIFNAMIPRALVDGVRQSGATIAAQLGVQRVLANIPANVSFYASCAQSSVAEYCANGIRAPGYMGTLVTDTGGYITINPAEPSVDTLAFVSRVIYRTGETVDGGLQGCVRFKYTPLYSGYPTYDPEGKHAQYIMDIGTLVNNSWQTNNLLTIIHYNAAVPSGKFMLLVRNADGSNSFNLASGTAWSAVSGQEYEMELDWNFVGGNGRCTFYVDGVAYVTQTALVCDRGAAPNIGFGDHMYRIVECAPFKIRDIQMFKTEQHSAATYVVAPLTSVAISSTGIDAPSATFGPGAVIVPTPTEDAHAATRAYAQSVAAVSANDATFTSGAASVIVHMHFLDTSGLVTCHFTTLGGAGNAPEIVTTLTSASAIPAGLIPAAGYSGVRQEFKVGAVWFAAVFNTDRSVSITRTPAWAQGESLNFSGTIMYSRT